MSELQSLADAIVELDEDATLKITSEMLAAGDTPPITIIKTCQQAMRIVGERYERHEYYLAGLIMAGEIFKDVLDLVQPYESVSPDSGAAGTIILATVKGDIHDIGKNIFGAALRGYDFRVVDLGVDVATETIVEAVKRQKPAVVCLSGLITTAFQSMKETVEAIRECSAPGEQAPPVVLGGGTVDDQICRYTGADSWSNDALEGVKLCLRLAEQPPTA